MAVPTLQKSEFDELQDYIHSTLGIWLPEGKMTMVEQRIRPLVVDAGLPTFSDFIRLRLRSPSPTDLTEFVNRITTNHTYFARESEHFDYLKQTVLPELVPGLKRDGQGTPIFRMWCCAASRGHEPYTLAMLQRQYFGNDYPNWDAGLLATDISERSLKYAIRGVYPDDEVQALPADMRQKFFNKRGNEWEVHQNLRKDVLFRSFNLNNSTYRFRRPFDVVFCRNVLIYFNMPTKLEVVGKLCGQMKLGGYLFLGLAESIGRGTAGLKYVQPGVYKKIQ